MTLSLKFETGLKELKADLSEIADLKDQVSAHDAKIAALQARIRSVPKQHPHPPTNQWET
jgi:predicted  nucleic acid-binding Zn-ribbon protein